MCTQHARRVSRRKFLGGVTLAGAVGLLGLHPRPVAAEPPPETTTLRLIQTSGICSAPQYVAEDLLHAEGFADVQYLKRDDTARSPSLPARSISAWDLARHSLSTWRQERRLSSLVGSTWAVLSCSGRTKSMPSAI